MNRVTYIFDLAYLNIYLEYLWSTHWTFYHKYPNLVRTQVEIISDPNYLVRIIFER